MLSSPDPDGVGDHGDSCDDEEELGHGTEEPVVYAHSHVPHTAGPRPNHAPVVAALELPRPESGLVLPSSFGGRGLLRLESQQLQTAILRSTTDSERVVEAARAWQLSANEQSGTPSSAHHAGVTPNMKRLKVNAAKRKGGSTRSPPLPPLRSPPPQALLHVNLPSPSPFSPTTRCC